MTVYARPSVLADCLDLGVRMRPDDVSEVAASSGASPKEALLDGFYTSDQCFTVIGEDDQVVSMFGVAATPEPLLGVAWMLCSTDVAKASRGILRQMPMYMDHFHRQFEVLTNYVDERNTLHLRWCLRAGFKAIRRVPEFGVSQVPFIEIARVRDPLCAMSPLLSSPS